MTDADRINKSVRHGARMLGPSERQRCAKHPTRWETYRWTWHVPGEGETHEQMIEGGDVQSVRACAACNAENEDES
jgi:hypothetical protein